MQKLTCPRCHREMPPLPGASDEKAQQVLAEITAQRLINAIKLVREITNAGLREAKDYVDCSHRPIAGAVAVSSPPPPPAPDPAPSAAPSALPGSPKKPFEGTI